MSRGIVAHAFHIGGVGFDKSYSDGVLWTAPSGDSIDNGQIGDFEVVVGFDSSSTDSVPISVAPFAQKQKVASSSYNLVLPATDKFAEKLLHKEHRTGIKLASDVSTRAQTNIDLDLTNSSKFTSDLENEVVYIKGESIKLGSYDSNSGEFVNCDRGYFESSSGIYSAGMNVYSNHEPRWDGRVIKLYALRLYDNSKEVLWRGTIDISKNAEIETINNGADLTIPTADVTKGQQETKTRRDLNEGRAREIGIYNRPDTDEPAFYSGSIGAEPKIEKNGATHYDSGFGFWRIQESLVLGFENNSGSQRIGTNTQALLGTESPDVDDNELVSDRAFEDDVPDPHEVFVVSQSFDRKAQQDLGLNEPQSRTRELDQQPSSWGSVRINAPENYKYHPLAIGMAIELSLSSTDSTPGEFDILSIDQFALDRKGIYGDGIIENVHELIQNTIQLQVDNFVLGWERSPVEIIKQIDRKLYHPFGFFRGIQTNGKLAIGHISMPSVRDLIDTSDGAFTAPVPPTPGDDGQPGNLSFSTGRGRTAEIVEVIFDNLPWKDGSTVFWSGTDGDEVPDDVNEIQPDFEVDLSVISSIKKAVRRAERLGVLQSDPVPEYTFEADEEALTGASYDLGGWISPDDLPLKKDWFVSSDGTRINNLAKKVETAGILIGADYQIKSRTYVLEIMAVAYVGSAVKLRCPSLIIIDTTTDSNGDVTSIWVSPDSEFGAADSDADEVKGNDDLYFCTQDGQTVASSGPHEIDTIASSDATSPDGKTGREITLKNPVSGTNPSDGQIARFAGYDNYSNPGWGGEFSDVLGKIHVWLADSDHTLGSNDKEGSDYG